MRRRLAGIEVLPGKPRPECERRTPSEPPCNGCSADALLSPDVVIQESGGEESRAEYRSPHLAADIEFARAVRSQQDPVRVRVREDVAWASSTRATQGEFRGRAINSAGAELMVLTREPGGWRIVATHWSSNLNPYDSRLWNINSASASSFRNTLEGFVGSRQIHNAGIAGWTGPCSPAPRPTTPYSSCITEHRPPLGGVGAEAPGVASYLPDASAPAASGLTRLNENMWSFGRTATDRYFGVDVTPAGVVNSKAITWYDSDLPELVNETGGFLAFTNVPGGLTTYKAVRFKLSPHLALAQRVAGSTFCWR